MISFALVFKVLVSIRDISTVRAGDLAPDHSDLAAADLLLGLVDVGDLLAEVEAVASPSACMSPHLMDNTW